MKNEIKSSIELHDSDVLNIENHVLPYIASRQGVNTDLEDFRLRCIELFEQKCGLRVTAFVYSTNQPGLYAFDWQIEERTRGNYDPDKQVHQVVNNVLDIPEDRGKGVIKTDPGVMAALEQGDYSPSGKLWTPGHTASKD